MDVTPIATQTATLVATLDARQHATLDATEIATQIATLDAIQIVTKASTFSQLLNEASCYVSASSLFVFQKLINKRTNIPKQNVRG